MKAKPIKLVRRSGPNKTLAQVEREAALVVDAECCAGTPLTAYLHPNGRVYWVPRSGAASGQSAPTGQFFSSTYNVASDLTNPSFGSYAVDPDRCDWTYILEQLLAEGIVTV